MVGGRNLPPPQKTVDCMTLRSFICVSFQQLTFKLGIFIGLNYKGISIKLCWRVFANWCQSKVEKTLEGSIVSHHSFFSLEALTHAWHHQIWLYGGDSVFVLVFGVVESFRSWWRLIYFGGGGWGGTFPASCTTLPWIFLYAVCSIFAHVRWEFLQQQTKRQNHNRYYICLIYL